MKAENGQRAGKQSVAAQLPASLSLSIVTEGTVVNPVWPPTARKRTHDRTDPPGTSRPRRDRGAPRTELSLVTRARGHGDRPAIIAGEGTFRYRDLLDASARVAECLLAGRDDLAEARVAFLTPPGFHYVAIQWGIWRAGGIAVPLAVSHPAAELEYVIRDAEAETVVVDAEFAAVSGTMKLPPWVRTGTSAHAMRTAPRSPLPAIAEGWRAMSVYTSGTTGKPKRLGRSQRTLAAQVTGHATGSQRG